MILRYTVARDTCSRPLTSSTVSRPRLRKSWGDDAFSQPDFVLARQLLLSLRFEGFPDVEAERLASQMTVDLQEHQ
jgi:hypothetical protein